MKAHTEEFSVRTRGKGTYKITGEVQRLVERGLGIARSVAHMAMH